MAVKFRKNRKASRGVKRTLITAIHPKSPVSEQYRTIRTNIQFSMVDQTFKTLACTSAMPGEGKSTTTTNLAVTLAEQGKSVLLVDADLRKPTVHQIMEVDNRQGLTSLLTMQATIEEVILPMAKMSNLYVLPSGPIPPNPAELLGSNMM